VDLARQADDRPCADNPLRGRRLERRRALHTLVHRSNRAITETALRSRVLECAHLRVQAMPEQTVVTTGANSGIGFQVSLHFARQGARVVLACRSAEKAREAQRAIAAQVPSARTLHIPLDVSELGSVRAFGERFADEVGELDVLINNAGIVALPLTRTSAGHELLLATNYLGAFALTGVLLPYFKRTGARIVNVGSIAHRFGRLNIADLNWESTAYDQWKAYANSKVALLSHTLELNRRLRASASHIVALAAHPGLANTNIKAAGEKLKPPGALRRWYQRRMERFIPTAEAGARSVILAATAAHVAGGEYFGPGGWLELGGEPKPARLHPATRDSALSQQLWNVTESMTGARYLSSL
jgi:NAD(P)-dependent dehydrogenase (short-subunit alcohol dehydrogenase family)